MSKFGKVETEVEIKAAADRFHEFFARKPYEISNISPEKVPSYKLVEVEWGKVGCLFMWHYVQDGRAIVAKVLTEAVDDENYTVTYRVVEGDPLQFYKCFKITVQVTPKVIGNEGMGSVVHMRIEYEKLHDNVPDPHVQLQWAAAVVKETDAHITVQRSSWNL